MVDSHKPADSTGTTAPKGVYVKSYGCQMNVYDSQKMVDVLGAEGYREVATPEEAEIILLNTCHIRERAAEKVYSELGRINELKQEAAEQGRSVLLGVTGCVAQAEGTEITRRARYVDLVVGPQNYHRLTDLIQQARSKPGIIDTEFPAELKFDHLPDAKAAKVRSRGVSAFLTVQEGCDKFCTFCVVPYTRGAEVSRSVTSITRGGTEAGRLRCARDHLAGPERQCLSWRGTGRAGLDFGASDGASRRDRGAVAVALHHLPSP